MWYRLSNKIKPRVLRKKVSNNSMSMIGVGPVGCTMHPLQSLPRIMTMHNFDNVKLWKCIIFPSNFSVEEGQKAHTLIILFSCFLESIGYRNILWVQGGLEAAQEEVFHICYEWSMDFFVLIIFYLTFFLSFMISNKFSFHYYCFLSVKH